MKWVRHRIKASVAEIDLVATADPSYFDSYFAAVDSNAARFKGRLSKFA